MAAFGAMYLRLVDALSELSEDRALILRNVGVAEALAGCGLVVA